MKKLGLAILVGLMVLALGFSVVVAQGRPSISITQLPKRWWNLIWF